MTRSPVLASAATGERAPLVVAFSPLSPAGCVQAYLLLRSHYEWVPRWLVLAASPATSQGARREALWHSRVYLDEARMADDLLSTASTDALSPMASKVGCSVPALVESFIRERWHLTCAEALLASLEQKEGGRCVPRGYVRPTPEQLRAALLDRFATAPCSEEWLRPPASLPRALVLPIPPPKALPPPPEKPMTESNLIRVNFEGKPLVSFVFRGRPCWVATDAGRHLGYGANGKGLVDTMRAKWADELIEGVDFDVLEGEALAEFKANLGDSDQQSLSFSSRLVILYESGFNLVCIKTEKPLGKKLRRFLADEVLPKLRRREPILPGQQAAAAFSTEPPPWALDLFARLAKVEAARTDRFPDGLLGDQEAAIYIRGPLRTLARQLASVRGKSVSSVLMRLERRVRKACQHPKDEKGRTWARLPAEKLGRATLTIGMLYDEAKGELQEHAERIAREAQVKLAG